MKKPYVCYSIPPESKRVEEYDEVKICNGIYSGFVGVVASISEDGWVKLWPTSEAREKFPNHPGIEDGSLKCWFERPLVRIVKRHS